MELPITDRDVWTFKQDTNGRWIWLRHSPDGEPLTASRANYERLDQCVADAERRGYKADLGLAAG